MKTYQAFAKTSKNGKLTLTEIRAKNLTKARKWFNENTVEHEPVYLKKDGK